MQVITVMDLIHPSFFSVPLVPDNHVFSIVLSVLCVPPNRNTLSGIHQRPFSFFSFQQDNHILQQGHPGRDPESHV